MLLSDTLEGLTFQQHRILRENEMDLNLWGCETLKDIWEEDENPKKAYEKAIRKINLMREEGPDYSTFIPEKTVSKVKIEADFPAPERIMGRCPCPKDGELTRCCNLRTLDAVQQCAFGCAYCSIRSFYSENTVKVVKNLDEYLEKLKTEDGVWHIGTGQSSDSLLFSDDYGTLTALGHFAQKHPEIIIELKSKAARTDFLNLRLPKNMVFTWSLNARSVAEKEELMTASVEKRLESAVKTSEAGYLTGFHIHPMVYFKGWEDEYASLVKLLTDRIDPEKAVMVGIGTLTFTKQNLRTLREGGRKTLVTKMPLTPAAGKYSYPLEIKKKMFSFLYDQFPSSWKENVFFYLCMEDPSLWEPCLKRKYNSNKDFDDDMKSFYFAKVRRFG